MATPPSSSTTVSRRVVPPCWTKEETLALIQAYKDKWFALRRRNLKASDWDAVSAVVSSASDPETAKSSVQCRHKIEKLRQRYRAEKQRCLKNPGNFSSSWDLFPLLDSMNFASSSVNGSVDQEVSGFYWKLKNHEKIHGNSGSNLGFDRDFSGGYGPNQTTKNQSETTNKLSSMGEEEKKPAEEKKMEPEKDGKKGDEEEVKQAAEKPAEEKKSEGSKEETKEETPPPPPQEIVLKVYMHCEGCARKVRRCLKGFQGFRT